MYILLIVLIFVLGLLFIPIKAVAVKENGFDFYFKVLFFKIKIKDKNNLKKKKKASDASKKKFSISKVKKIYSLTDEIKDIAKFFAERCIVVDNIKIYLKFGTGDAAQTGIATGILNTVAYSFVATVHQNVRLKKWSVDIIPDFEEEKFDFEFLCIGTTRLLHIIGIGIKGLKLYKKFRQS